MRALKLPKGYNAFGSFSFCYCYNNPTSYVDPNGQFAVPAILLVAAVGFLVGEIYAGTQGYTPLDAEFWYYSGGGAVAATGIYFLAADVAIVAGLGLQQAGLWTGSTTAFGLGLTFTSAGAGMYAWAFQPLGRTPRDYPLGFESRRLFHRLAKQLKRAAGVQDAIVGVTGSSTSGVSYKTGEPFGPASDIDFFIVSDELAAQVPRRFVRPNELIDMGATLYFDELRRFEELATQELGRKVTVRIYSSTGYQLRAKPTDIIVP